MERHIARLTPDGIRERLGRDPELLLEIGCNDGMDTLQFATAFPNCHIVAFEPDPRAIVAFKSVIMKAGIYSDRCELVECAVSNTIGLQQFYSSSGPMWRGRDWDLSSSICKPTGHLERSPEISFTQDVLVPTLTLDSWWGCWLEDHPDQSTIDFIWCDPQGSQAKIIAGGQEALWNTRWLYTECYMWPLYEGEPNLGEIVRLLDGWEFVAMYEKNENALFRNLHENVR